MRKFFLSAFMIFLAVATMITALPAQPKDTDDEARQKKRATSSATREEVESLREMVKAQQREIQELKVAVERLLAANPAVAGRGPQSPQGSESAAGAAGSSELIAASPGSLKDQMKASQPPDTLPQSGWNGQHFFIRSSDGRFAIQPTGYVQFDHRAYDGAGAPPATFVVRRGRFGFTGEFGKHYEFTVVGDFADRNSTLAREFSLNINYRPEIQAEFGQFKAPFSQDDLTKDVYTDFVERALTVNLSPGYSPGFQVHGQLFGKKIEYNAGAFNGKGYLNLNTTSTPEGILRLRFYPWRDTSNAWLKGFAVGGAIADGRAHNGASITGLMPTGTFTFFQARPVNGAELRANGEMTWIKGPFALRAEYDQTNQARWELGANGGNLPGIVAKAYYATATYLLTGENRPENGQPVPRFEVFGKDRRGIGAWEVKFRYSNMQMADGAEHAAADQFSTGVNWYLNGFTRYMFDFNVARLKDPVTAPVPLAPQTFLSILQRIQFRF